MALLPVSSMLDRVERYGADSDSARFTELLYAGELILKITTAAFISAIEDDRENQRYRLLHALVRADGVGSWSKALDEALTGPASQHLSPALADIRRQFTERCPKGAWQHTAVHDLRSVLQGVHDDATPAGDKVQLRAWFQTFSELRNKTRGHGAITPAACARLVQALEKSILALAANNPIFQLEWAYLHRNLSGKYKVVSLSDSSEHFSALKSASAATGENYKNGIYLYAGGYRFVDLFYSNLDVADFFLPNGGFQNGTFELHSLLTDSRLKGDATPYLAVATDRPPSETEGQGELDVMENVFSNLPAAPVGYVRRPELEAEVVAALTNDRHPVVTLVGRGGIGKTSLALTVLREIAKTGRYSVIVWFSARDIDLLMSGAKPVQPHLLTEKEISTEYARLLGEAVVEKDKQIAEILSKHMRESPLGATLFAFDNFETARSPVDLFQWIDTNIRLPNKAVITSRFREFKADFPISVTGMEFEEAVALVDQTASALGIKHLIAERERAVIIEESNGHPYVIKIILGEIATNGKYEKPSKLIARKDDILEALFERTFASLSPMASRIFLTLSGWRSLVPQLAVEAVLLRYGSGESDPESGIDQLVRMSLIERTLAGDGTDFLEVPLAAALFGRKKLEVSPIRTVIENDIKFLQDIGTTVPSGLKEGVRPRVEAFFRKTARRIGARSTTLDEMRPVLEFLARGYPPAWILLSELEQETGNDGAIGRSAESVRRFLETKPSEADARFAWQRLVVLYREADDVFGGCSAFLKASESTTPPLNEISSMANWLNNAPQAKQGIELADRSSLFKPLARLMEQYVPEASATDLSRLAWLHLHCGQTDRARQVAELGLERDPENTFCHKLVEKLGH